MTTHAPDPSGCVRNAKISKELPFSNNRTSFPDLAHLIHLMSRSKDFAHLSWYDQLRFVGNHLKEFNPRGRAFSRRYLQSALKGTLPAGEPLIVSVKSAIKKEIQSMTVDPVSIENYFELIESGKAKVVDDRVMAYILHRFNNSKDDMRYITRHEITDYFKHNRFAFEDVVNQQSGTIPIQTVTGAVTRLMGKGFVKNHHKGKDRITHNPANFIMPSYPEPNEKDQYAIPF